MCHNTSGKILIGLLLYKQIYFSLSPIIPQTDYISTLRNMVEWELWNWYLDLELKGIFSFFILTL